MKKNFKQYDSYFTNNKIIHYAQNNIMTNKRLNFEKKTPKNTIKVTCPLIVLRYYYIHDLLLLTEGISEDSDAFKK